MNFLRTNQRLSQSFIFVIISIFVTSGLYAEVKETYDYPELMVTPRASERLATESKQESSRSWSAHLPIQSSALFTIAAGFLAMSDQAEVSDSYTDYPAGSDERTEKEEKAKEDATDKDTMSRTAGRLAIGVGGAWLLTTTMMSVLHRPYRSCKAKIKVSGKNKRSKLARERAAEECIMMASRTGKRLAMFSIATNFLASSFVSAAGSEDQTQIVGGAAAIWSIMPWIFNYHWSDVSEYHQNYKKRIYGPITSSTILYNERTKSFGPALSASISF